MKNLKKIIIGLIVIAIIIILVIAIISLMNKKENGNNSVGELKDEEEYTLAKEEKIFFEVNNYDLFYTTENIINDFVKYIEYINQDVKIDIGKIQMTESEIKQYQYEEGFKAINELLDKKYKEKYSIENKDIIEFFKKYKNINTTDNYQLQIKKMYMSELESNSSLVLVSGTINNVDFNCMIKLDIQNSVYSIFLENYLKENNYTSERAEKIVDMNDSIEKNDYNNFQYVYASNEFIVTKYFSDYKEKMLENPQVAYSMLDEEYRTKRFTTYNEFLNFIDSMKDRINKLQISKFKLQNSEIDILDNYNNICIFNVNDLINYTIQLDDYTIETDEYINTYKNSNDEDKVYMNIEKFFKMANNKDYNNMYNILDEEFKKNNYATISDLKKFKEQNLFDICKVTEVKNFKQTGEYYVISVRFVNMEQTDEEKSLTVIMKLMDDTTFKMSFSI